MFKLSWKNLTNKPLSLLLTLILFALGTGMISLLLLVNKQVQEKFENNLAGIDLVVGAKGSPLQLILCNMYHIDAPTGNVAIKDVKAFLNPKHPLVKSAVPLSLGDSYKGYRIVGTIHDYVNLYNGKIAEGRLWKNTYEVTIGASLADDLGMKIGDKFDSSHGFVMDDNLIHEHDHKFEVVGIFEAGNSVLDQVILCSPESIWEVHDHDHADTPPAPKASEEEDNHEGHDHDHGDHSGHDHAHDDHSHDGHDHHDHADHSHDEPAITTAQSLLNFPDKEITSLLVNFKARNFQALNMQRSINENTDMQAATPAIEINRLHLMMGVGVDALKALAFLIVFVSGLSIFISLFNSLKERKYELALIRVMGASRGKVFFLVILEGLLLAFMGYLLGIFLSHVGMFFMSDYLKDAYRYNFNAWEFMPEEGWLLVAALAIGFVAALIPAVQASRTDIAETLTR